jgi:two-component system, NarL family, invasion response regulator UvrY
MLPIPHTYNIALVDDHILMRDALAAVINGFEHCRITHLACNGKAFIEGLQPDNIPNLVILDVNMPVMDGYETAAWLRTHHPSILILILTMYDSEVVMIRLLQCGVRGFLKKDIHPSELKIAIETTMASGFYYSNHISGKLVNLLKSNDSKHPGGAVYLTEKELEFLKLSSSDYTYKEIARNMSVSPRTVDNYRDSLFVKLGVKSRVGLVMFAIRNGVVQPGY